LSGSDLPLPVALDTARLDAQLWAWAPAATRAPADATFAPDAQGGLAIAPDRPGLGIDPDASRAAFLAHAARLAPGPLRLAQMPVPAGITAPLLASVADEVAAAIGQPLALRLGERTWGLGSDRLREALRTRLAGARPVIALDPAALHALFDRINREAGEPGEAARLVLGADGRYTTVPGRSGTALDEGATVAAVEAALGAGRHEAAVVFRPQAPARTAAELAPDYARLDAILNTPLVVTFAEFARTFGRADLAPLLGVAAQPDRPERLAFSLARAGLLRLAGRLAEALDRGVQDAQFRWVDGRVQDVVPSREGRTIDVGATADRLGDARSDYSFSIPSRRHNVELATGRLDGTLIPPGGLCSFNAAVGAQTIANGYREAYGIALVGGTGPGTGQVATVSSVAGGICQVATMLFQAAYRAGLPIEERNRHLYWIPGYGPTQLADGAAGARCHGGRPVGTRLPVPQHDRRLAGDRGGGGRWRRPHRGLRARSRLDGRGRRPGDRQPAPDRSGPGPREDPRPAAGRGTGGGARGRWLRCRQPGPGHGSRRGPRPRGDIPEHVLPVAQRGPGRGTRRGGAGVGSPAMGGLGAAPSGPTTGNTPAIVSLATP
jgi:vancomycin resistance protein YoaR